MKKKVIKKIVRNFLNENVKEVRIIAGVLIKCSDTGRVLLLERNDGNKKELWSFITGGVENNETVLEGLKREVNEEIGIDPEIIEYKFIDKIEIPKKNKVLHYYEGFTKSEFKPILNDEHHDWGWFDKDDTPSPLFPKTQEKIDKI